ACSGRGRPPVTVRGAVFVAVASTVVWTAVWTVACAPKPRYAPPPPAVVPAFKETENWKPAQPRDADARGVWWDLFGDPALATLEPRIDVSNQTLKIAEAQFAQARAAVRGARANLYPQVISAPGITVTSPSANRATTTFHDTFGDFVLPIDVTYEADVWGRLHGIVEA